MFASPVALDAAAEYFPREAQPRVDCGGGHAQQLRHFFAGSAFELEQREYRTLLERHLVQCGFEQRSAFCELLSLRVVRRYGLALVDAVRVLCQVLVTLHGAAPPLARDAQADG